MNSIIQCNLNPSNCPRKKLGIEDSLQLKLWQKHLHCKLTQWCGKKHMLKIYPYIMVLKFYPIWLYFINFIWQGFIQALLLTVFHEGLSFMDVGHNPACISTSTLAAVGSRGCCKSSFGYFSAPGFSNSLSIKTQNSKSCESN